MQIHGYCQRIAAKSGTWSKFSAFRASRPAYHPMPMGDSVTTSDAIAVQPASHRLK